MLRPCHTPSSITTHRQSQPTNSERWSRFSTLLKERGRRGDVDRLCEALRLAKRVWAAEETAADLCVERGELQASSSRPSSRDLALLEIMISTQGM